MLNPNLATAWFLGGWVRLINGEPDVAIEHFAHVERLSPFDPFIWGVHAGIATAHFVRGAMTWHCPLPNTACATCLNIPRHSEL